MLCMLSALRFRVLFAFLRSGSTPLSRLTLVASCRTLRSKWSLFLRWVATCERAPVAEAAPLPFTLEDFSDLLFLLIPIRHGWGIIGRDDKFLSPVAVDVCEVMPDRAVLRMKESGPVSVWRADGRPTCATGEFEPIGDGLWHANLAAGAHEVHTEAK